MYSRSSISVWYSHRDRGKQYSGFKSQATSMASVGNVRSNRLECQHCGRRHPGECRMNDQACFKCGSQEHFIRDFPEMTEKEQFSSARPSNATNRGVTKDSAVRSEARAPARAYAIRTHKDASSPDVITVSNPLGKYVLVDKVCKNCPLIIRGHCFPDDLMLLPFDEFDVILGMDWLTLHDAIVNCRLKTIELKCENGVVLRVETGESSELPIVISSIAAQRYIRKGCETYFAYVLNIKMSELKLESVPVVCEYPDVFPEELPGLPPIREVEFAIDLVPGTSPISIAPYRMAPTELKELKAQLQELTDKGFCYL
ncbi:Gag protease polyprotein-like protein [Gossypium australe]|uniref:Gag protease polyprotein-like protein n=1 Tax=Gossypium australe TaxID=47621 RepID=A0A5B6VME9_9ROSI|nr:Gag protease polyprotein-like protein [Gossypium australe]